MKKIIALILALTLLTGVMSACKHDDEDTDGIVGDTGADTPDSDNESSAADKVYTVDTSGLPGVDILNDDLSDYIEIDEKYYKNYTVLVDPNRVTDFHVGNELISVLCQYKSKEPIEGDGIISVGDVVNIYYKGYYLNSDGTKNYFSGGSNMDSSKPHELEIGSCEFVPGFEYNLIGKTPDDYSDDKLILVEAHFPKDYKAQELAGITAYFEVKVVGIVEYSVPEIDDAFITDTLKMADAIADYEGETLADKLYAYVREWYMYENDLDEDTLIQNAFWESVMAGAVVKKYPEKQVMEMYNGLITDIESYYMSSYYSYMYEFEQFVCLYIGLSVGADWRAELRSIAENRVKQQLVFYHIMNQEGLRPSDEEYERLFDEYLVSALEASDITPDKFLTEAEYLAEKEKYKKQIIEQNGEDYFKAMICYEKTMEAIIGYANVVETLEK